ncbi:hypothetical protein [Paraburkholderia sp. SOS3]|uniref:hypothetical protein n=1 Tax=Paraburkholderia sp. SOS3 TaxID=1926494 RepID=UPI00094762A0|nr:hypothetical protein [Paraburkholderia sp. SOS3]APR40000.1 hypothetical protein BTO02_33170 [Paraburkholderia sp. SOS3]
MLTIFRRRPTGITRDRVLELKHEALCARTARRQRDAKAALSRQGVAPRTPISTGYVPEEISRVFTYTNVGGVR